ncbi:hypothetical protein [Paenibacillus ginsengarvi]|uniref:hypothetical protein n=1 Tax=Paenibacillus ginsengarvi TaxID=400777 RepID=UPI001F0298F4|nr:hypothetical protein [Paenibacillus ginsengarvi]
MKPLAGELKVSHKKTNFGISVSTKEVVLHKPHVNYYMNFEDIVSITPFDTTELKQIRFVSRHVGGHEVVQAGDGMPYYNVYAKQVTVHNRSGLFQHGAMRFIIPIDPDLMRSIGTYGAWDVSLDM